MKYLYTLLKLNAKCCRSRGLLGICLLSIQDRHLGATCCLHLLPVKFKCLSACVCMSMCAWCVNTRVHSATSAESRAQVGRSRGWTEMRILRTLCSHVFKLQPFPDERLDSNPVCSTGVNSYPSASNIQRKAPVFCRDDCFSLPSSHLYFLFRLLSTSALVSQHYFTYRITTETSKHTGKH